VTRTSELRVRRDGPTWSQCHVPVTVTVPADSESDSDGRLAGQSRLLELKPGPSPTELGTRLELTEGR
jgi:hypothetical protein